MIARENPTSGNTMNDYRPQRHMPFRGWQVLYRWIALLQLTALVLSYNFSGCNHHQIKKDYKFVIFASLNKINTTGLDGISSCSNTVTCLMVIDRTSPKVKNCSSEELMNQILSTLSKHCPDYSGWQAFSMPFRPMEGRITWLLEAACFQDTTRQPENPKQREKKQKNKE